MACVEQTFGNSDIAIDNTENNYVKRASSLYDSKMSIDYHNIHFHAFSERWYDSTMISCRFIVGSDRTTGKIAFYIFMRAFGIYPLVLRA